MRKTKKRNKEKERIENEEAVKKFGKEGKSSGQSLKSIFGISPNPSAKMHVSK